jgi:hypothetical protein
MPFCPNCGSDVGMSKFCPNCGAEQGFGSPKAYNSSNSPPPQTVRVTSGLKYDDGICLLICCCLSPVGALIYYLLTEHPEKEYRY